MKIFVNLLTGLRIILSGILLFLVPFSLSFYAVYIVCGITDMLDGFLARMYHCETQFGATFDSIADLCFVVIAIIVLFPVLEISFWLWVWIGVIVLIKITNLISGCIVLKKPVFLHTIANKITGFLLLLLPLTLKWIPLSFTAIPVCAVASFAAVQEGHLIRTGVGS